MIGGNKYKMILCKSEDLSVVQLILYSKPINFLKKLLISHKEILRISQEMQGREPSNNQDIDEIFKM